MAMAASLLLLFTACTTSDVDGNDNGGDNSVPIPVSITTAVSAITRSASAITRSASTDLQSSQLTPGAKVGIFAKHCTSATFDNPEKWWDNITYTVQSDGSLKADNHELAVWYSLTGTPTYLYAYIPYESSYNDLTYIPFKVKIDQTAEADYIASDLLITKAENLSSTSSAVKLTFTHALSKMTVHLTPGEGMTLDDFLGATVTVSMADGKNEINLKTQETETWVAEGTRTTITLHEFSTDDISAAKNTSTANSSPQTLTAAGILNTHYTCTAEDKITLTLADGATFSYSLPTRLTLAPNKAYLFDFTVNNLGIEVKTSIQEWDGGDYIYDGEFIRQ